MAEIEYDETLRVALDRSAGSFQLGVRTYVFKTVAQYRTALRFVTLHDLAYDWNPDTGEFTIYPPD